MVDKEVTEEEPFPFRHFRSLFLGLSQQMAKLERGAKEMPEEEEGEVAARFC